MITPESQSRNYSPENFNQNLDDMLKNLASQRVEGPGSHQRTDAKVLEEGRGNLKSEIDSTITEDAEKIDLNLPQMADIVNMQDEEYEANQDPMEAPKTNGSKTEELKKSPGNESFKIKNIETGESYDLREQEVETKINPDNCLVLKGVPWNTFWKNIRKSNEALWDAAEAGESEKVKKLLEKSQAYPAEIDSKALDDWTALHMASNGGHHEVVNVLIKYDANIEAKTSMARTPLHLSCMRGNRSIVGLLVDSGANVNALDKDFCTPLHYASEHGFTDVVVELIDKKDRQPDVSIKNHAGLTCIDVANSFEVRKLFEDRGLVNDKTISSFGRTCVDDALLYNSRSDMIGRLLMFGNKNLKLQQSKSLYEKDASTKAQKAPESRFSNVKIHDWTNEEAKSQDAQVEKIGPQSFVCHLMLGKGSFGEVYLVEKISSKKLYAMKVLRKDRILNQNLTRYARTERNVLSIMNHPFIVKLSYAFQTENKLYLLLDYCPGGDLGNAITKKKRFSEDLARIYAAEITLALEALHSKDIIFRDLKPDNVVLDAEGHALLTDFGLSKEGVKEGLQKSFCGSVAYLAPEMLRRSGHNKTVDWYLLGVLIYEMLVGMPPYFSSNRDELFDNIKKAQLKLPKALSEEAKNLITNLLKRDPAKRMGATMDANEIKNHPWFKDINWQDVMDRKLTPPLPDKKTPKLNGMANHKLEESYSRDKNYISGWSFINHEDM